MYVKIAMLLWRISNSIQYPNPIVIIIIIIPTDQISEEVLDELRELAIDLELDDLKEMVLYHYENWRGTLYNISLNQY